VPLGFTHCCILLYIAFNSTRKWRGDCSSTMLVDCQRLLMVVESNVALQEFLRSHNPHQQHSATLESFLIKPIQRILKYPLLLRQLTELTDPSSSEHAHLRGPPCFTYRHHPEIEPCHHCQSRIFGNKYIFV